MTKKTLQELGIHDFFYYKRGKFNAITDIPNVKVGHSTIIEGNNVRTGVTAIIPGDVPNNKFIAGGAVFNANGEVTGLQYIFEEGRLSSPIFLTNTCSLGDVYSAVYDYYGGKEGLPIVGECWDGYLNDIYGRHVKKEHVVEAIETASSGSVQEGNVGAGTGMTSFGFKSGIGTSSRKVTIINKEYTVGVLVNNNMGNDDGRHRYLRIAGVDIAKAVGEYEEPKDKENSETHHSSSILVIGTDAPLGHYQLNRLARHGILGIGRVGLVSYAGSGDFVISFSTANKVPSRVAEVIWNPAIISENSIDNLFEATLEAVEEAYLNSLLMAEDMVGLDGHKIKALPIEKILKSIKPNE